MHPAYLKPWVVGLRLDPTEPELSLFFVQQGEDLLPLMSKGRLLSCVSLDCIPRLVQTGGSLMPREGPVVVEGIYDMVEALAIIRTGQVDPKKVIAPSINFLLDCIKVTAG